MILFCHLVFVYSVAVKHTNTKLP